MNRPNQAPEPGQPPDDPNASTSQPNDVAGRTKVAPVTTGEQQVRRRRGRFRSGESGNPAGRPPGSRHKATLAAQALLDGEAEAIARKAVEMALDGDTTAMRLVMDRLVPPRRSQPVQLDLGPTHTATNIAEAQGRVIEAVAAGDIGVEEAAKLSAMLEARRSAIETADLAEQIELIRSHLGVN